MNALDKIKAQLEGKADAQWSAFVRLVARGLVQATAHPKTTIAVLAGSHAVLFGLGAILL